MGTWAALGFETCEELAAVSKELMWWRVRWLSVCVRERERASVHLCVLVRVCLCVYVCERMNRECVYVCVCVCKVLAFCPVPL